jgi:hypothetical protein
MMRNHADNDRTLCNQFASGQVLPRPRCRAGYDRTLPYQRADCWMQPLPRRNSN